MDGFELNESDWQSFSTFFPAENLYDLYSTLSRKAFPSNILIMAEAREDHERFNR